MHVIMHVEVGVDMLEILITLLAFLCIVLVWVMLYDWSLSHLGSIPLHVPSVRNNLFHRKKESETDEY